MINRILKLLCIFLILTAALGSCLKKGDPGSTPLFVGEIEHLKSPEDVIDAVLLNFVEEDIKDNKFFKYLNLYDFPYIATQLESCYLFDQNLAVSYEDSCIRGPFDEYENVKMSTILKFFNQSGNIVSMEMLFDVDTLLTVNDTVKYHFYEKYYADTMYIVGKSRDEGYFMAYGMTDCIVRKSRETSPDIVIDEWEYNYPAWTIIVGNKVDNGIKNLRYYECVADTTFYYKKYSIRVMNDDFSDLN